MLVTIVWVFFGIFLIIKILSRINGEFNKSFISLISNFLNCIISFIFARIFINLKAVNIGNTLLEFIGQKYSLGESDLQSLEEFATFLGSILTGIIMFYIFYFIISIIMFVIKHFLLYKIFNKQEKSDEENKILKRIGIVACTVISVSLTFIVLVTPIGFLYNSYSSIFLNEKKKVPFVSKIYLDKLTQMPENINNVYITDEVYYTLEVVNLASSLTKENNNYNTNISSIQICISSKTHFLPTIVAELASTGASYWKNEEEFLGYAPNLPEGREGKLDKDILEIIEKWNKKSVIQDVNTTLDVYKQVLDYGIDKIKEKDGILDALSEQEFTEKLFVNLYKNDDFAELIPVFIEYGLGSAFDYINIDFDNQSVSNFDIRKFSEDDIRREARLVADVIGVVKDIITLKEKIQSGDINLEDFKEIEEKISNLKDSKILGDIADELEFRVKSLLPNFKF